MRCTRITPPRWWNYTCWAFTTYTMLVTQPRNAPLADPELLGYLLGSRA